MKLMKRVWAALLLLAASGQLYADEGMWVLKELNKQNLARMAELGFTPSYGQLYSAVSYTHLTLPTISRV